MSRVNKILIDEKKTILDSMRKLDQVGTRCLFIVDKHKRFKGILTDGDLRRYILKFKTFDAKIDKIYNKKSFYVYKNKIKQNKKLKLFLARNKNLIVPVLNDKKNPIDYLEHTQSYQKAELNNLVLIMAGGRGLRMRPFTDILPKPLIPINKKPVILNIFDQFKKFKFNNFLISMRSEDKILINYLSQFDTKFKLNYVKEKKPLGSGGCLKLLKKQNEPFFMINCDSLIKLNPIKLLNFHNEKKSILTIVVCLKSHMIPYGQCEIKKDGFLKSIIEKPNTKILANVGMYVIDPKIKNFLPKSNFFDMDTLIKRVLSLKKKISIFPIQESEWKDSGNWDNYFKAINENKH